MNNYYEGTYLGRPGIPYNMTIYKDDMNSVFSGTDVYEVNIVDTRTFERFQYFVGKISLSALMKKFRKKEA